MNTKSVMKILGLAGFTVMADNWVVSPILPAIAQNIGVSAVSAGILIAAYMIPFGIFQLVFGPLADRFGKRQILMFTMIFFTLAAALTATGRSLIDLTIYRALTGIFAASVMPVSLALIADMFQMPERHTKVGTFMGISFLGQGLSMAMGGVTSYFFSWRIVFIAYAILAAIVALLFLTIGKKIPSEKNPESKLFGSYKTLLTNWNSLGLYLGVLFEGLFILGSFSYLGVFIHQTFKFNNLLIGLIMTAFGAAAVMGGRMSGILAAKHGRKMVLLSGLTLAALSEVLLFVGGNTHWVLILSVAFLGLGFMLTHSSFITSATQVAPMNARGSAMSLMAFFFMSGGGMGTAMGGRILSNVGYGNFFLGNGLALFALMLLAALFVSTGEKHAELVHHAPMHGSMH
jgi:predicted MFS family arabinose efflux permease